MALGKVQQRRILTGPDQGAAGTPELHLDFVTATMGAASTPGSLTEAAPKAS
jgi:hypothetical protein